MKGRVYDGETEMKLTLSPPEHRHGSSLLIVASFWRQGSLCFCVSSRYVSTNNIQSYKNNINSVFPFWDSVKQFEANFAQRQQFALCTKHTKFLLTIPPVQCRPIHVKSYLGRSFEVPVKASPDAKTPSAATMVERSSLHYLSCITMTVKPTQR